MQLNRSRLTDEIFSSLVFLKCKSIQGVSLTGRNTTGPPSRAARCWVTLHCRGVLQTTRDASEQNNTTPCVGWCRRASNEP